MNWYKVFYWVTVSDGVKHFFDTFSNIFTALSIISFIIYIIVSGVRAAAKDSKEYTPQDIIDLSFWVKRLGIFFWTSIIVCIITWGGYMATPDKKDCLTIIAGGAVGNFITGTK